jgi:hypothetical protein
VMLRARPLTVARIRRIALRRRLTAANQSSDFRWMRADAWSAPILRTYVTIIRAGLPVCDGGVRAEPGLVTEVERTFVVVAGTGLIDECHMLACAGHADINGALVVVGLASDFGRHRRVFADPGRAIVLCASRTVIGTRGLFRNGRIAVAVLAADVVGAFVAITLAGTAGNGIVFALPV